MKVLHIVPDLPPDGLELFLLDVLPRLRTHDVESRVVSLRSMGPVGERLQAANIPVIPIGMSGYFSAAVKLPRLKAVARQYRPDVIQGWLYHGNLAACFARAAVPTARLLWGIRHSLADLRHERRGTRMVIHLNAWSSRTADCIVYNSKVCAAQHIRAGFAASNTAIIPNGVDTEAFKPDWHARQINREKIGIGAAEILVGIVGRYHAVKGQDVFVRAAVVVARENAQARFAMVGRGVDDNNRELVQLVAAAGLQDRCALMGERADVPGIINMFDVAVSASWGEGFPNAVAEAMACEVPCVVTDVGASRELAGDSGEVVSPGSPGDLAKAILKLASLPGDRRRELGAAARQRVLRLFSRARCVADYAALYENLVPPDTRAAAG